MKNTILLFSSLILCNAAFSQINWTSPIQVDDNAGTFPRVVFSPSGKLLVFYYNIQNDSLVLKKEISNGIFAPEINITPVGKNVVPFFTDEDSLVLLVPKGTAHWIFESNNSGTTFIKIASISSTSNLGSLNTMSAAFTRENNSLRLFYTYNLYNPVTGDKPQIFQLNKTNNLWDSAGTFIADGMVAGAIENDSNVCVAGTRGTYQSTNNGSSYSEINPGAPYNENLRANHVGYHGTDIIIIRNYSSLENVISCTKSSNTGGTWTNPQDIIFSSSNNVFYPKISANGDTMVACWLEEQTPQMGINGYMKLMASYSFNYGLTWSNPDTIFYGTNYLVIPTSFDDNRADFDISNYNGRFVVTYSAVLNNLPNNQHTFIREVIYDSVATFVHTENINVNPVIYPNPSRGFLKIETPAEYYTLHFYSLTGQLVKSFTGNGNNVTITLKNLPAGNYFVEYFDSERIKYFQLITD